MEETLNYQESMLTTDDNPFDPFTDFKRWFAEDCRLGYYTSSYLARIANIRDDMSQKEECEVVDQACDEIIQLNPLIPYKKVVRGGR